jgi:Arc/MetJ-type ribon-helix-helix transcriptional regulator
MNIKLTPEQEQLVEDVLNSGEFESVDAVLDQALRSLKHQTRASRSTVLNGPDKDAVRQMIEFAERNRTRLEGTSIKDLIHEGHRL